MDLVTRGLGFSSCQGQKLFSLPPCLCLPWRPSSGYKGFFLPS